MKQKTKRKLEMRNDIHNDEHSPLNGLA